FATRCTDILEGSARHSGPARRTASLVLIGPRLRDGPQAGAAPMQPTRISAIVQTLEQRVFFAAQTIDAAGDVGQFASLAINPLTNRPSVAYYDATNGDLKLATLGKSGWSTSSIATAGDVGKVSSLKFNRA